MRRAPIWIMLALLLAQGSTLAQQADSLRGEENNAGFIGLPVIFSTPETSWGFGAALSLTYKWKDPLPGDRPSQISLLGIYTLEEQLLLFVPFNIYSRENRYNFLGEVGYYKYVYPYFGLGNHTSAEEEYYEADYPRMRLFASRQFAKGLYSGFYLGYDRFEVHGVDEGGALEAMSPRGIEGGVTSELGWHLAYDTRDEIFYPQKGIYGRVLMAFAGDALGSDYSYRIFRLDLRNYRKLSEKIVLANRLWWEAKPGEPPFYNLPELGGHKSMRGVVRGRYRDRYLLLAQAEFRFRVYKRWAAVAFGSLGKVGHSFFADLDGLHWAAGGGIRFAIDRDNSLHMRMDYAFSRDMNGFYFTVGEAF